MYYKPCRIFRRHRTLVVAFALYYLFVLTSLYLYIYTDPTDINQTEFWHSLIQDGGRKQRVNKVPSFVSILPGVFSYSAYLDARYDPPKIRIISMVNDRAPKNGLCFFWPPFFLAQLKAKFGVSVSNLSETQRRQRLSFFTAITAPRFSSPITFHKTCEGHALAYVAYYLSCDVPAQVRASVSSVIITKGFMWSSLDQFVELQVTSIPRMTHKTGISDHGDQRRAIESLKIGVCVPPLFGSVNPDSLMEFIEATMVLGTKHFIFYDYEISDASRELLRFYEKDGTVSLLPWNLPFSDESIWYHGQSVAIADCLFRTMGHFDWVMFNDIDEFMIPRSEITSKGTIPEFLVVYEKLHISEFSTIASLAFQSAIFHTPTSFLTNIKKNTFKSLSSVVRTKTISKVLTKQIVRPERVFELGIHHLSSSSHSNFTAHMVSPNLGLLHHYRECKPKPQFLISCEEFVEDKTFKRYTERLKCRVHKTAAALARYKPTS